MTAYITLNKIRSFVWSESSWEKLLDSLKKTETDDEPLALTSVLESNGLDDALWCLQALDDDWHKSIVLFAADCAEHILPIFEKEYPNDKRPRAAIEAARSLDREAAAKAADYSAKAAADAADDAAAWAAKAARAAAWAADAAAYAAPWDAYAAAYAARAAAYATADYAADAAWAAALAARDAARDAARAAARAAVYAAADAAGTVETEYQKQIFIKYFG